MNTLLLGLMTLLHGSFLKNTFAMIGAILGSSTILTAAGKSGKGPYGEDENRDNDSRRCLLFLIAIALGALGLLTISVLTPRLTFNFDFTLGLPNLLVGVLALILITAILLFLQLLASILRARRKSLRTTESNKGEAEMVLEKTAKYGLGYFPHGPITQLLSILCYLDWCVQVTLGALHSHCTILVPQQTLNRPYAAMKT